MTRRLSNRDGAGTLGGVPAPDPLQWRPVPSALDGRRYVIRSNQGPTDRAYVGRDRDSGVMQVPTGDTARDRRVRLHEMAHVRWTPAEPKLPAGVSHESFNACEDARMNKRLREIGLDAAGTVPLFTDDDWTQLRESFQADLDRPEAARKWTPLAVAQFDAAAIGATESGPYRRICRDYGHGWIAPVVQEMFERHLGSRRPAWKRTLEFAAELEATFAELGDATSEAIDGALSSGYYEFGREPATWGKMTVREMPLVVRLPRGLRTKVRRSSDTGAVPRYWHRVPVDQRVFAVRRYKPSGGTVLIDQSGSMHLDPDDVQAIMAAFPAVTVATYATEHHDNGEVRVIARNGQRASDDDCFHPGRRNVIDGPALEWLAAMPEPRIWVSDGLVTGLGESQHASLVMDAARICTRGRIRRVDRLEAIVPEGAA